MQKYSFIFPGQSPTELKADPFLGARILQHAPEWILREAERWPHPWRFLLGVRQLPPACYDLFRAAESVSRAMDRIQQCLYGGATIQRDLRDEMQVCERAGDVAGATRNATKIVRGMVSHNLWTRDKDTGLEAWATQVTAVLKKKHGCTKFNSLPMQTAEEFSPLAFLMITTWLCWGKLGEPGLCYYTEEARADLLVLLRREDKRYGLGTRTDYFKKSRQRLGLEPAYPRKPLVIKVRRVPNTTHIEIESRWKQGTTRHILCPAQKVAIGGQQLYPLKP